MIMELLSSAEFVPQQVRHIPKYVGDHAIRHYKSRHISDLQRDLGLPEDQSQIIEIIGGIGTLIMRWNGNEFNSTIPNREPPPQRPDLTTEQIEARRATCHACPSGMYEAAPDRCRMCGCSGMMAQRTTSPWASCPREHWPC